MRCGFTRTYTLSITRHTSIGSVLRRLFLQFCLSSDVESRTRSSTDYCTAVAVAASTALATAPDPDPAHKASDEYGKAQFSSPMSLVFFSSVLSHLHVSRFLFQLTAASSMSLVFSSSILLPGIRPSPAFLEASTRSTSSPRSHSRIFCCYCPLARCSPLLADFERL